MINIADILGDASNCLLFKNNVEYKWVRFIQGSKMRKGLMTIFFSNPTLALMQEYLSYKNINKIKVLLTELLYSNVT